VSPDIVLSAEAMKAMKDTMRNLAKVDPEFAKSYSKVKSKVSADLRVERILEANPEIKDERERKQKLKDKRKAEADAEKAKNEARRLERQQARDLRRKLEQEAKDKKNADFSRRVEAAGLTDDQRKMLVKMDLFPRDNNGVKECKVLVSFKNEGKYDCKDEVFEINENETEEQFSERMDNELIGLLISVKEKFLS
jgi:phage protein D